MKTKQIGQMIGYAAAVGAGVLLLVFVITCSWIGFEVKNVCREAKRQYGGDCVEGLISQLEDERRGYGDRNDAIWALGQLGDKRALLILNKYYTGEIPEREPYDGGISQYELKKAVNLAGGGTNVSATFWRYGVE